jgi:preprotein translocase subunit YajC
MSGSFLSPAAAFAQAAPAAQAPSGVAGILASPLVMMGIIFVIIYLLIMRPQQKKQKEMQEMLRNLQKGDKVVTQSGIHGTIAGLDEKTITLQVADQVRIRMSRWSVAEKVTDEIGA